MQLSTTIEAVTICGLLATALLVFVAAIRSRPLRWLAAAAAILVAGYVTARVLELRRPVTPEADVDYRPVEMARDGYASSKTCQGCHPEQYASWHASYHRTMTQVATPENVVASFDDVTVEAWGRSYDLSRDGDALWAEMDDPYWRGDGPAPRVRRRIVLTTGSHHEQDFWFAAGPGRAVAHFPLVYRIPERRWLPNGSTFMQPPFDHSPSPRPERGGWNRNCLQCHATRGIPHLNWPQDVATETAELGIACEACHGPGAEHVRANRDPLRRYELHEQEDPTDDTIVNPARLDPKRSAQVCGQCHMVSTLLGPRQNPHWNDQGASYRPGDELEQTRDVLRPALGEDPVIATMQSMNPTFLADRFWSDGMIRVSGREYHGLLETPCYQQGPMTCLSCHTMHEADDDPRPYDAWADDQLIAGMDGDRACLQCHEDYAGRIEEHTHHPAASSGSRCYDCHMPHTTFGLLKAIRSHEIDSPNVATTLATGRPNACNLCHLDRTLEWTARNLQRWYGIDAPALTGDQRDVAASVLWLMTGDAGQRALVGWSMGWQPALDASNANGAGSWVVPYLAHLLVDPYDAVRFVADGSLRKVSMAVRSDYDFLAAPDQREAARARIVDAWRRQSVEAGGGRHAMLADAAVLLDERSFARLAALRDDRRVELRE